MRRLTILMILAAFMLVFAAACTDDSPADTAGCLPGEEGEAVWNETAGCLHGTYKDLHKEEKGEEGEHGEAEGEDVEGEHSEDGEAEAEGAEGAEGEHNEEAEAEGESD